MLNKYLKKQHSDDGVFLIVALSRPIANTGGESSLYARSIACTNWASAESKLETMTMKTESTVITCVVLVIFTIDYI